MVKTLSLSQPLSLRGPCSHGHGPPIRLKTGISTVTKKRLHIGNPPKNSALFSLPRRIIFARAVKDLRRAIERPQ